MDKHDTLLIACGEREHREHLRMVLEERYNLLEAVTIPQILLLLQQNLDCICAVLIDASLQSMADKMLLLEPSSLELLDQAPMIVISSDDVTAEQTSVYYRYGAADVIPLHHDPYAMLRRIDNIAQLHTQRQRLQSMAKEQADVLRHSSDSMVDALSSIIECRSVESGNHILRVRCFTRILMDEVMRTCPEYGLTDRLVTIISSASALHDIGKIAIPDAILMKPGQLTEEEWEIMKTHSLTGCRILDNLKNTVDEEYLRYAHNICHYHHERWDGSGHPEGLRGDDIPICAQVVGLADAYDALTSQRVYKGSYSFVEAVNMILKGECGAFSPKLLECFKNVTEQFDALTREYSDGRAPNDSPFDMSLPALDPQRVNSLDHARAMYYALIHYANVFMVEVDLDQEIFHVIYNPYPEIASLHGITTLPELLGLLKKTVIPEEQALLHRVLHQELPRFFEEDLRRSVHRFHYLEPDGKKQGAFDMVFLRPSIPGQSRRSLAVLCRKMGDTAPAGGSLDITLPASSYICRNDRDFTLVRLDDNSLDMGGYSLRDLQEGLEGKLIRVIHPEDREMVRREFDIQLEKGTLVRLEHRVVYKNGETAWVSNKSRLIPGEDGKEYLFSSLTDITHTKAALEHLKQRMHRYEVILAQTENVLFEWDVVADTIEFSDTWAQVFGRNPLRENVHSLICDGAYFHPDDTPLILDCVTALENGSNYEMTEVRIVAHQGRYIWCRFRASAARDANGRLQKVMGIIINIDTEKQAQRALQDRADRDSLTKLLNKSAGRKQAEAYLARFPEGIRCALLIIDLDDFKAVNDQYGHLFGDAVLTRTARTIEAHFQAQDIVARIGGDEFMILVRGVADRNLLHNRCLSLTSALTQAFRSMNRNITVSCSIGVALAPECGKNYYDLFQCADQALYRAKAKGKNTFCFYEKEGDAAAQPAPRRGSGITPIDSDVELGLAEDSFVRYTFQKLYTARDVKRAVQEVISLLGRKMNVSRVYVFENSADNRYCSNTFEWCNDGIEPAIHELQMVSYETDIPGYEENFNEQGLFYLPDITLLPQKAFEIVDAQGIKSMLQCAIRQEGVFRGYIGFDECVGHRLWTKEEIHMLTFFSDILSIFLQKYREQEENRIQAEELGTILDNQNGWIYIIDPDTWELKYLNKKARERSPNVTAGMVCYKALLGRDAPCEGCPARGIRKSKTCTGYLNHQLFQREVLAEATLIQWEGREGCLMSCRALPPRN